MTIISQLCRHLWAGAAALTDKSFKAEVKQLAVYTTLYTASFIEATASSELQLQLRSVLMAKFEVFSIRNVGPGNSGGPQITSVAFGG